MLAFNDLRLVHLEVELIRVLLSSLFTQVLQVIRFLVEVLGASWSAWSLGLAISTFFNSHSIFKHSSFIISIFFN